MKDARFPGTRDDSSVTVQHHTAGSATIGLWQSTIRVMGTVLLPLVVVLIAGLVVLGLIIAERYPVSTWKDGLRDLRSVARDKSEPMQVVPQDAKLSEFITHEQATTYMGTESISGLVEVVEKAMDSAEKAVDSAEARTAAAREGRPAPGPALPERLLPGPGRRPGADRPGPRAFSRPGRSGPDHRGRSRRRTGRPGPGGRAGPGLGGGHSSAGVPALGGRLTARRPAERSRARPGSLDRKSVV